MSRITQAVEPLPLDAVAHVESKDHIERNLSEADEVHLLRHVVVQDLEIGSPEPRNRPTVVGGEDINADDLDL